MTISRELIDQLPEFDTATLYEAAGQRRMVDPVITPCGPEPRSAVQGFGALSAARQSHAASCGSSSRLRAACW